jgi:hypothetical protein
MPIQAARSRRGREGAVHPHLPSVVDLWSRFLLVLVAVLLLAAGAPAAVD